MAIFWKKKNNKIFLNSMSMMKRVAQNTPDIPFRFWRAYILVCVEYDYTMCVCSIRLPLKRKKKLSLFFSVVVVVVAFERKKRRRPRWGEVMMMYLHISFSFLHIQTKESLVFLRESGGADEMLFHDGKRLELLNAIVHTRVGTTTTTTRRHICIA